MLKNRRVSLSLLKKAVFFCFVISHLGHDANCDSLQLDRPSAALNISFYYPDTYLKLSENASKNDLTNMGLWNDSRGISSDKQQHLDDGVFHHLNNKNPTLSPKDIFKNYLKSNVTQFKNNQLNINYSGHGVLCLCDEKKNCQMANTEDPEKLDPKLSEEAKSSVVGKLRPDWCIVLPTKDEQILKKHEYQKLLISDSEIKEILPNTKGLYLDSCHSGKACDLKSKSTKNDITIFASSIASQETPLFNESGILWNSLGKLTTNKELQCVSDFDGDGYISEQEAAIYVTVNFFKCGVENQLEKKTDVESILSGGLQEISTTKGKGKLTDSSEVIPDFKFSDKCMIKIKDPAQCQAVKTGNKMSCSEKIKNSEGIAHKLHSLVHNKSPKGKLGLSCPDSEDKSSKGITVEVGDQSNPREAQKTKGIVVETTKESITVDQRLLKIKGLWTSYLDKDKEQLKKTCIESPAHCEEVQRAEASITEISQDLDKIHHWIATEKVMTKSSP